MTTFMRTQFSARALAMIALLAASSTACQKYEGNKILAPVPDKNVESLQGKSTQDAMKMKYNSASLTCTLYVQHGSGVTSTTPPSDSFSVDLLKTESGLGTFTLKGEVDDLSLASKLTFDDLTLSDATLTGDNGVVVRMKTSPAVTYDIELSETLTAKGTPIVTSGTSKFRLFERMNDQPLNMIRTIDGDEKAYHEVINCLISTDPKPAYIGDYKPVRVKSN